MMTDEEREKMIRDYHSTQAAFDAVIAPSPMPSNEEFDAGMKKLVVIEKQLIALERINMFTFISMFMSGVVIGFVVRGWL